MKRTTTTHTTNTTSQNGHSPPPSPLRGMEADVWFETVQITPEDALKLLERNYNNRSVSDPDVESMADDMASGNWRFDGTPIRFDPDGNLLDGQHRLWAIIQSGVTITQVVMHNAEPELVETIDTGRKRSLGQTLTIMNEHNATTLAAVISHLSRWERGHVLKNTKTTHSRGLARFREDPEPLRKATSAASRVRQQLGPNMRLPAGPAGACWYVFHKVSYDDASVFFEKLAHGYGLDSDDPILAMRKRLQNPLTANKTYRNVDIHAQLVKTWNAWMQGDSLLVMKWTRGGARPEGFPGVYVPEGEPAVGVARVIVQGVQK